MEWTIAYDGKNKGVIKSHSNSQVTIVTPGTSLTHGKRSTEFSGWKWEMVDRPLVLVANGQFNDPDHWKLIQPNKEQVKVFKTRFRKEYPEVKNCDGIDGPYQLWAYPDSSIKIKKVYQSTKGDQLVEIVLEGYKCDGPPPEEFKQQVFLFQPDKSTKHLTLQIENANSPDDQNLYLVDAGDYDGDGTSEVIFFISGYNEDGYVMFYDSFRRNIVYTWHYH